MSSLYVDGCSFVYGDGLDRRYALGNLLNADLDLSECGKSNIAMCEDLYSNIEKYDTFVIGFTFSNRYSFCNKKFERKNLCVGAAIPKFGEYMGAEIDEAEFEMLRKLYIKFSDLSALDLRSDFYIDSAVNLLEYYNKNNVFFSWEKRNTKQHKDKVLYVGQKFIQNEKLSDGHLNENGMKKLANIIRENL